MVSESKVESILVLISGIALCFIARYSEMFFVKQTQTFATGLTKFAFDMIYALGVIVTLIGIGFTAMTFLTEPVKLDNKKFEEKRKEHKEFIEELLEP